jgi:FkbM family methyltransferase
MGRYGEIWFHDKDKYIGRGLKAYGEFSHVECMTILSLAVAGNGRCLDVGANMGCISQMLEYNGLTVIAFEPQPELVKCLEKNFKGCIQRFALGSSTYKGTMPKYDYDAIGSFGEAALGASSPLGTIEVNVVPLDSMYFGDIGFIKIDVEGHETEVLRGARETILKNKPIMYIEDDREDKSAELHAELDSLGYTYEKHITKLYNPENYFNNRINIWDKDYVSINLICKPKC